MELTLEELKAKMAACMSEETILDILGLTSEELVQYLSEPIEENFDKWMSELSTFEESTDD